MGPWDYPNLFLCNQHPKPQDIQSNKPIHLRNRGSMSIQCGKMKIKYDEYYSYCNETH